tara:strand:+ start:2981 stop:3424 length:444 start_codon:yes stop_codon:yes gene_type:complete
MKKFYILIFIWTFFPFNIASEETFLSLKKNKVNVRYGPSFESPIKYVYKKINLPIKQIDKKENWRRIIDVKNNSGWIHWSQLKKANSLISLEDKILFNKPSKFSKPLANIKKGRILVLLKCQGIWCKIKTKNFKGWIKTNNVWGLID